MESTNLTEGGNYMKPLDPESIKLSPLTPNMYNEEHHNYAFVDESGYQRPMSTGSDIKQPLPSPPTSPGHMDKNHTYDEIPHTKKLMELQENGGVINGGSMNNGGLDNREMNNPIYDASGLKLPKSKLSEKKIENNSFERKKSRCYRRSVCIFAMVAFAFLASIVAVLLVVFYNAEIIESSSGNLDKLIGDTPQTTTIKPSVPVTTVTDGPTVTSYIQVLESRILAMEQEMQLLRVSNDNLTQQVEQVSVESQQLRVDVEAETKQLHSDLSADIQEVDAGLQQELDHLYVLINNDSQTQQPASIGFEDCTFRLNRFKISWDSSLQDSVRTPDEGYVWIGVSCYTNGINAFLEVNKDIVPHQYQCICSGTEANIDIQNDIGVEYDANFRYCIIHRWECPILSSTEPTMTP